MLRCLFSSSVGSSMADTFCVVVCLMYLIGCLEATKDSEKKFVIDHDGGADDIFAITLTLLNEKYFNGPKLIALTTSYGNVNLSQAIINSDRVLSLCDRQDIPIYAGADKALISTVPSDKFFGEDGLGDDGYTPSEPIKVQKQIAALALIELSKKYEGKLVVIVIGPLTNIALAIRLDPYFLGRLAHLYIGAGNIESKQYPKPEFNAYQDPEAYHIVAKVAIVEKVTILPLSTVRLTLNIGVNWRINVLGKIVNPIIEALNGFEQLSIKKEEYWTLLDPAVVFVALFDLLDEIEFKKSKNDIIWEGSKRGIITNDFKSKNPNVRICVSVNLKRYKTFLLDIFGRIRG